MLDFTFDAELWIYQGRARIYFVTVPADIAQHIKSFIAGPRRGWGAIKVSVKIGQSRWRTSIFPMGEEQSYILPIKAEIRKAQGLDEGDTARITLSAEPDL
jgi:hypothetical protein